MANVARPLLILALWLLAFGDAAPAGAQPAPVATVEALVGTAVVTRQASREAVPLAVGAELFEGDRIRTELGSRLRLRLHDGSVLTCGEATGLTLDETLYAPAQDTQSFLVRVSFGIVRSVVELLTPQSSYEMQTNTAVISVRGTEWIAEVQRAATAIVSLEGEVAVRNVDPAVPGEVTLGPGEGVTVEAGTPPPAPTVWGDARRNAFIERTSVP
ncbi:MAG TPA: FecR family protein [Geminicoccaceae bacterium]|nr:FecR family protein [Geminicoccaceae bacterium]